MVEAGILASRRGKVRLLKPDELPEDWDPATDAASHGWEMVHQLIRLLEADGEERRRHPRRATGLQSRDGARTVLSPLYAVRTQEA